jgi:GGDEF domain-containing protein
MASAEETFDPRAIAAEIPEIAEHGLAATLDEIALPCGRAACLPFSPECVQPPDQTPELAAHASAALMAMNVLGAEIDHQDVRIKEISLEAAFARELADRLSVDKGLGIMTFNSQKVLYEVMESTGLLEKLHAAGYVMELLFLDMDYLKSHNVLGDHAGGDEALAALVRKVKSCYQRRTDFVGISGYREEAEKAAKSGGSFSQVVRYERGDEVIAASFSSPSTRADNRRNPTKGLEQRRDQIVEALSDTWVEYPMVGRTSEESIADELAKIGSGLEYHIENGVVRAPISAAFAIVRHPVPRTLAEFENLARVADANMAGIKNMRDGHMTRGAVVNFLTE